MSPSLEIFAKVDNLQITSENVWFVGFRSNPRHSILVYGFGVWRQGPSGFCAGQEEFDRRGVFHVFQLPRYAFYKSPAKVIFLHRFELCVFQLTLFDDSASHVVVPVINFSSIAPSIRDVV
jgi:hypothetical protein